MRQLLVQPGDAVPCYGVVPRSASAFTLALDSPNVGSLDSVTPTRNRLKPLPAVLQPASPCRDAAMRVWECSVGSTQAAAQRGSRRCRCSDMNRAGWEGDGVCVCVCVHWGGWYYTFERPPDRQRESKRRGRTMPGMWRRRPEEVEGTEQRTKGI